MKSVDELNKIKDEYMNRVLIRTDEKAVRVIVGMGNSGIVAGARDVLHAIVEKVSKDGLDDKIIVMQEARVSRQGLNPVVEVCENGKTTVYTKMNAEMACRVIDEHIKNGNVVTEYEYKEEQ